MIKFHLNYTNNALKTSEEVITTSDYMEVRAWMYDIITVAAESIDYNPNALRLEVISGSSRIIREYGWTNEDDLKSVIREDLKLIIELFKDEGR